MQGVFAGWIEGIVWKILLAAEDVAIVGQTRGVVSLRSDCSECLSIDRNIQIADTDIANTSLWKVFKNKIPLVLRPRPH